MRRLTPFACGVLVLVLLPAFDAHVALAQRPMVPIPAPATNEPTEFGVGDYTVTVIPASSFTSDSTTATDFGSLFRYFPPRNTASGHFFHGVDLPSGAVIDFVGFETRNSGYPHLQANLFSLDRYSGSTSGIVTVEASLRYGYGTDYNPTALGWQLVQNAHNALVIDVYQRPYDCPGGCERLIGFGWIEIWWKRQVSPPPNTPSFADVPTFDSGYPYIEALKASGITGGCGGDNYCPGAPLTRRQMAIFLAKALGLHWPN